MSSEYAYEKLYLAVRGMAVADKPLRTRLAGAAQNLFLLKHQIEHFLSDADLRRKYQGIMEDLTINEAERPGEGRIDATCRQLSDHDAAMIAGRIFDLFDDVRRLLDRP